MVPKSYLPAQHHSQFPAWNGPLVIINSGRKSITSKYTEGLPATPAASRCPQPQQPARLVTEGTDAFAPGYGYVCYLLFSIPLHAVRSTMAAAALATAVAFLHDRFSLSQTDIAGHSRALLFPCPPITGWWTVCDLLPASDRYG